MKMPKPRLPIANKPNVTHKDKSVYTRKNFKLDLEELLDETEDSCDDVYELEMEMSSLCCRAERLIDGYRCTCPLPERDFEAAAEHIEYLRSLVNKQEIANVQKKSKD